MPPDHYDVLDIAPDAGPAEIRAAYLRVMRSCHPDRRPGDPAAGARARDANAAYRVLRDPTSRAAYDRVRTSRRGSVEQRATSRSVRLGHAEVVRMQAYSAAQHEIRDAFHVASLKLGVAVLAVGVLLLMGVAAL